MKFCWAQYLLWLMVALLGVGSMLSACGQKGALQRPEQPAELHQQTPATLAADKKE